MIDEPNNQLPQPSLSERVFNWIGFLFAIFLIFLTVCGGNHDWLKKVPVIGLIMLIIGVKLAIHFAADQNVAILRIVFIRLYDRSRTSNFSRAILILISATIGGIAGWVFVIRSTTEFIAACASGFGAVLCSAIAVAKINQLRKSPSDQVPPPDSPQKSD